ncbi:MAG: hypothetical protein ACLSTI_06800 [Ruminococcus sp.]
MKKWQIQQPDEAAAKNIQANSDLSLFCAELLTVRGYRTIEETASQFSFRHSDPVLDTGYAGGSRLFKCSD